jgi:Circularly permutated YpsA SLOG family
MNSIPKILSGGQTGADRAALDWALKHNLPCGGWCPKERKAEDGPIDPKYPLKETPSASYLQRTEWNVRDSDATVLFSIESTLTGGSFKTVEFARKHQKPCTHLCAGDKTAANTLRGFVEKHGVKVLNVAGPRASKEPGVGEFVMRTRASFRREVAKLTQSYSYSSSFSSSNPAAGTLGVMEFFGVGREDRRTAQSCGANSANNLSKRGSFRSGSHAGLVLRSP